MSKENAEKFCNAEYKRVLVFGGGENRQTMSGVEVGRGWIEVGENGK